MLTPRPGALFTGRGEPARFFTSVAPFGPYRPRPERDNSMMNHREGKKEDGKFYLLVVGKWEEVPEKVYYGYMELVWAEEKNLLRRSRCIVGGKRCAGNCELCPYERTGDALSLDQMYEETGFEAPSQEPSVEEQVLDSFLKEKLREELARLPVEDKVLIHDIYYEDVPYTQRQIARKLGISQVAVHKRHLRLLAELRVRLEHDICE